MRNRDNTVEQVCRWTELAALACLMCAIGWHTSRAAAANASPAPDTPPDLAPAVLAVLRQPSPVKATSAGIAYAAPEPQDSEGHLLDIYLPPLASGALPTVVWTGGSAWRAENGRATAGWIAQQLNPAGYAVVGVSVRNSKHALFPAQLSDMKAAIRWLRANASAYGLDVNRIAIMGDSSGGWNAAMTALTGDVPSLEGSVGTAGFSSAVRAAVAYYPPTDFLKMDPHMLGECAHDDSTLNPKCHDSPTSPESLLLGCPLLTCPGLVEQANPTHYISKSSPPLLIIHGKADRLVPYNQGELLYDALSKTCHDVALISLPNAGHGTFTLIETDDDTRAGATIRSTRTDCHKSGPISLRPTWETIIAFLDRTTKS